MAFKFFDRVRDTTVTSGTGAITLAGTPPFNYQAFSARFATNDQITYTIVNQQLNEWEVGQGTITSSNSFSRDVVFDGTAGVGTLVNFTSNTTKDVWCDSPATYGTRETLTGDRQYYVRDDGSDSNTGLQNTSGGAFLTLQHAYDVIVQSLDMAGHQIIIQVTGVAFTKGISFYTPWVGGGSLIVQGDTGTPSNVVIAQSTAHSGGSTTAGTIFDVQFLGGFLEIRGFKLSTSGSGTGAINLSAPGNIRCGSLNLAGFSPSIFQGAIAASAPGAWITVTGSITISGNMDSWVSAVAIGAYVQFFSQTITLTGTPAWGWFGVECSFGLMEMSTLAFSGSATGSRYESQRNGIIATGGAGATFLPGSTGGSTSTQGQYI